MDTSKKTIIVFSGDFDKVFAAFVIANGAAAMGDDVTMFFTFWGLNALRRPKKIKVEGKSSLQKAFAAMMPRGPDKLKLSHMNFAGAGPKMFKTAMKQKNVMSLDELIDEVLAYRRAVRMTEPGTTALGTLEGDPPRVLPTRRFSSMPPPYRSSSSLPSPRGNR